MSSDVDISSEYFSERQDVSLTDAVAAVQRFCDDLSAVDAPRRRRRGPAVVEQFAAVIRSSPCSSSGAASYSDARYYVDRAVPRRTVGSADTFDAEVDTLPGVRRCLTATNLAEIATGTHLLPAGTIVQAFALYTRSRPPAKLHVFNQPPAWSVVVQITGAASGGGKYTGTIVNGSSTATASGNLAMPEGMGGVPGTSALILNPAEDGLGTHQLQTGTYHVGRVVGTSSATTIVQIDCIPIGVTASPTTLGGTTEGSESASSDSWNRASGGTPLDLFVVTRMVYNEAGDKVLYQFVRKLSFDACGLLVNVTGESRVTIDATEAC